MRPLDLIATAKRLVGKGRKGPPRQSDLRRAQSTAYYAMFHALCRNCADSFIGKTKRFRSERAWTQAYRAVSHGTAKKQCKDRSVMERFPTEIQDFAAKFVELQENRHRADYDPSSRFTREGVLTEIVTAEIAVRQLQNSAVRDRRAFAVWTSMRKRPD